MKINFTIPEEQELYIGQLLETMEYFSSETYIHMLNTAEIALTLAERLKLDNESAKKLYIAALVHDAGKLQIASQILHNPHITAEEYALIKKHPINSMLILKGHLPDDIVTIAFHHHEMPNGKGYPQGLSNEQLSELDKMLAVCDVTSALVLPRSYKDPLSKTQVIDILTDKAQKGELDKTYTDAVISCYVKRSDNVQTEDGEKNFHFDDNATQSTSSQDNVTQNGTAPTSANQNNEKEGREQ